MSDEKEANIVEFIPREKYEQEYGFGKALGELGDKEGKVRLPKELNRQRVVSAFMDAFELIGGTPRLAQWADLNETEFYKLWARLLPSQASAELAPQAEKRVLHVLPRSKLDE